MVAPIEEDKSLLMFSNSDSDNSFDEIKEAFTSPLFLEHNFKKLSIIFDTKNILRFSIKSEKKFFKFFEKLNLLDNKSFTLFWLLILWVEWFMYYKFHKEFLDLTHSGWNVNT